MSSSPVPLSHSGAAAKTLSVTVDSSVYSRQVVLRAVHSLAPRFAGHVSTVSDGGGLVVELISTSGDLVEDGSLRNRFLVALGDFVLRERLERETFPSRSLIIEQAFERNNLQLPELDTAPPGLDPLGLSKPDPETGRDHDAAS